jgi:quercetin dioxygenase-like cupin family protein
LSLQFHAVKKETMYCVDGVGYLEIDGKVRNMVPGTFVTIEPGQVHRLGTDETCYIDVLECSTTELDDVVRLEDDYERTG